MSRKGLMHGYKNKMVNEFGQFKYGDVENY